MLGLIFQHQFAVVRDSETNSEGSDSWSTQTYHISWKAESSPEHLREAVGSMGLPGDSVGRESACNAGDKGATGSIPGSERSPRGGHGYLLQYSCLQNPMDRGAWWGTVHGVAKSWTWLKRPSIHACMQPWQDQWEQPHPPQPAVFFSRLSVLLMYKLDGFCFPPRCFLVSWRRQIHQSLRISVSLHHHFGLFLVTLNFLIF